MAGSVASTGMLSDSFDVDSRRYLPRPRLRYLSADGRRAKNDGGDYRLVANLATAAGLVSARLIAAGLVAAAGRLGAATPTAVTLLLLPSVVVFEDVGLLVLGNRAEVDRHEERGVAEDGELLIHLVDVRLLGILLVGHEAEVVVELTDVRVPRDE
jgi:hypothetical protein